ncbi:hypothetical protein FB192DRAFT_1402969 [Mucor lusitanicus]|uniref:Uncharacterized protein n=1 Tax=Mucor circinelloides f. lusitanicus TaxID=29924 RepID=A0A8H4B6G8_MUCCL|nr:hypothetical protein FB192DRAFT_1402969 [Mucor lusitanicus]
MLYDRLDRNKMWKLSTGTIVEDKMREVALSMEYEHPTHSLILDISDKCWEKIFEKDEKNEIRSYRCTDLPVMSPEVESYLKELQGLSGVDLKKKVDSGDFPTESDSSWLQKSYQDAFRLVRSGFFPLQGQTETDLVKRVWSCVDTCFDFSVINSLSGEKCSKASADSANKERCLSKFGRQSSGRKMDYIFLTGPTETELGCGECALVEGVKSTKELTDANFKMPKVMKDMANRILFTRSGMAHDLCLVGFYMGANVMKMFTLDFPSGYVGRLNGIGPAYFPVNYENINSLEHVLRLILTGKMIMESQQVKTDNCQLTKPDTLERQFDEIAPTFVPVVPVKKKKRRKVH